MKEKGSVYTSFTEFFVSFVSSDEKDKILAKDSSYKAFLLEDRIFIFKTDGKVIDGFKTLASSLEIKIESE